MDMVGKLICHSCKFY